ncbi:WxL domain-containing protein [Vagococcus xieshaowenii]|uniref:WxL domain-containing protein n=1 Tax=Vagococcus xieshaowenii TaxID=2562451 RepID=A0AAJ5JQK8_9ENTE|nr:WxL domain-containing protein [Vagococcus xieshaowenii]QCA29439.1 WxL domain-containing protein [Vagococcus xieshaowenii]TFZ41559.1 WxL domain-containing protein [Vagococcus xieshaowenii]
MRKGNKLICVVGLLLLPSIVHAANNQDKSSDLGIQMEAGDASVPSIVDPEKPSPEKPIVPLDPDDKPGGITNFPGPLSLDFVSRFYFGNQWISSKDKSYKAAAQRYIDHDGVSRESINFIQITDTRGNNNDSWSVSVQQVEAFHHGTQILTGAEIVLSNLMTHSNSQSLAPVVKSGESVINSAEQTLVTSGPNQGAGTWVIGLGHPENLINKKLDIGEYGDKTTKLSPDIKLIIPGESKKVAQEYTATIDWKLKNVPGNIAQ